MTAALLLARGGVQVTVLEAGAVAGRRVAGLDVPPAEPGDARRARRARAADGARHRLDGLPVPRPSYRPDRRPRPRRAGRGHPLPVPGAGRAVQADPDHPRGPRRHGQRDGPLRPARGERRDRRGHRHGDDRGRRHLHRRLGAGRRRRQLAGAADRRVHLRGHDLPRALPGRLDHRGPGDDPAGHLGGQLRLRPDRVAGAAAHPGALADPLPDRPGHPRRGRERPGPGAGADARRGRPRPRLGRPAHHALPRPPAGRGHVPQGPAAADGRRRAHQQPARRHGHEQRHPRRLRGDQGAAGADPGCGHRGAAGRGVRGAPPGRAVLRQDDHPRQLGEAAPGRPRGDPGLPRRAARAGRRPRADAQAPAQHLDDQLAARRQGRRHGRRLGPDDR